MKPIEVTCFLCDTPGAGCKPEDDGNRQRIACQADACGTYVITNRAVRRLEEGGPNRDVLAEMVRQANSRARILDISVGGDGLILANEVPRHAAGE